MQLRVGQLAYPDPGTSPFVPRRSESRAIADPSEITVEAATPLTVRSGHDVRSALRLTNRGCADIHVVTNGYLTATVVNGDGAVGGYSGAHPQPRILFDIAPGESVDIPVLIGTASYVPRLGYAIPPGRWRLTVPLNLTDERTLVSPPIELTVT